MLAAGGGSSAAGRNHVSRRSPGYTPGVGSMTLGGLTPLLEVVVVCDHSSSRCLWVVRFAPGSARRFRGMGPLGEVGNRGCGPYWLSSIGVSGVKSVAGLHGGICSMVPWVDHT